MNKEQLHSLRLKMQSLLISK